MNPMIFTDRKNVTLVSVAAQAALVVLVVSVTDSCVR